MSRMAGAAHARTRRSTVRIRPSCGRQARGAKHSPAVHGESCLQSGTRLDDDPSRDPQRAEGKTRTGINRRRPLYRERTSQLHSPSPVGPLLDPLRRASEMLAAGKLPPGG